jgi:transposase
VTIVSQHYDHVIGVDTHAKTHTLMVLDKHGAAGASATFPTSLAGLKRAHAWMVKNASGNVLAAIEGTGSYGAQFAHLLTQNNIAVCETKPPKRGVRKAGKSDVIDAEHAARHVLSLPVEMVNTPRKHSGDRVALQVLLTARQHLNVARTATINQLTALLRVFNVGIDVRQSLTDAQITQITSWKTRPSEDVATQVVRSEAIQQAKEIQRRDKELVKNLAGLHKHVRGLAAFLLDETGIGPVSAAQIIASWSHPGRIHSEAAFARMAGIAPIPASSGNTTRHRLHRGGDRKLNNAFWVIAFHRYYREEQTKSYVEKRTAEGKTRKEILRCLKRYICRSVYRKLEHHTPIPA